MHDDPRGSTPDVPKLWRGLLTLTGAPGTVAMQTWPRMTASRSLAAALTARMNRRRDPELTSP